MFRVTFGFVLTLLLIQASAQAQVVTPCYFDVFLDCAGVAQAGNVPHIRCTSALCEEDPFELGTITCAKASGLKVTNDGSFHGIQQVGPNVWGRTAFDTVVLPFECGEVWTCTCDGKAVGATCNFGVWSYDFVPVERSTIGVINCQG